MGLGWTGPRERRERAKSGSEASRLMASEREEEALLEPPPPELGQVSVLPQAVLQVQQVLLPVLLILQAQRLSQKSSTLNH